jgi:COMPASS component SWD2
MFVAASTVLTFWIPDNSKLNAEPGSMDTEAASQSEHISQ